MTFSWTPHRFSGGLLALDVANSVILRDDDARRTDRFADPAEIARFAEALGRHGFERLSCAPVAPAAIDDFLALREAIDRHMRILVRTGQADPQALATLLRAIATILDRHGTHPQPCPLDLATARSALGLLAQDADGRTKICNHCGWLFIDRSRNRSRIWCDMAVCGNRTKAARFYRRSKAGRP